MEDGAVWAWKARGRVALVGSILLAVTLAGAGMALLVGYVNIGRSYEAAIGPLLVLFILMCWCWALVPMTIAGMLSPMLSGHEESLPLGRSMVGAFFGQIVIWLITALTMGVGAFFVMPLMCVSVALVGSRGVHVMEAMSDASSLCRTHWWTLASTHFAMLIVGGLMALLYGVGVWGVSSLRLGYQWDDLLSLVAGLSALVLLFVWQVYYGAVCAVLCQRLTEWRQGFDWARALE
jgi:hypothetical protein